MAMYHRLASKSMDRVVLLVAGLVVVVVAVALLGAINRETFDPSKTIFLEGGLYGNFKPVIGSTGLRGESLPYDSIWGPMAVNSTFVDEHEVTYGSCVGEGERKSGPIPELNKPFPTIICMPIS